jgi:hypothetical protein
MTTSDAKCEAEVDQLTSKDLTFDVSNWGICWEDSMTMVEEVSTWRSNYWLDDAAYIEAKGN